MESLPKSYKEAKEAGEMYYFTGKPCKNGHVDKRCVKRCQCVSCKYSLVKKWHKENAEYKKTKDRERQKSSRERHIFSQIKQRCHNPNNHIYPYYGGLGIECKFSCYEEFIKEVGLRPSPDHSVDRVNPYGHYEPGNVRWATPKEQRNNRRDSHSSSS